ADRQVGGHLAGGHHRRQGLEDPAGRREKPRVHLANGHRQLPSQQQQERRENRQRALPVEGPARPEIVGHRQCAFHHLLLHALSPSAAAPATSSRSAPHTRPNNLPYSALDFTLSTWRGRPKMEVTSITSLIRPGRAVMIRMRSARTMASSMEWVT